MLKLHQTHPHAHQRSVSKLLPLPRLSGARLRHPQGRNRRKIITMAKGPTPPELTGFWSTLISEQLSACCPTMEPSASYLISHGVGHLVVPLLETYLLVSLMRLFASKVQQWCESNPDQPMLTEVVEPLPVAIKGPTVFTLCTLVTLRMVYNAAHLLGNYMHKFSVTYGKAADTLLNELCSGLQPMGKALFKVYGVVMLFYACTVLVKLKSLGLSSLLERERDQQEAMIAASGGRVASKSRSMDDLERLLVPFDAATSWLMYAFGFVVAAQIVGVDIAPLVAVGGASSIILGLATQQLLTNAFMGLSLFFTRPFVDGDSVLVQGSGAMVSGVVEKTTVMRTTMRTDDDVVVTIPNKMVADMIVYNRSAEVRRSRLASVNRQTENIKMRLKLPYAQESKLRELQETVKATLEPPPGLAATNSSSSSSSDVSRSGSPSSVVDDYRALDTLDIVESIAAAATASAATSSSSAAAAPARPDSPLGSALKALGKPKTNNNSRTSSSTGAAAAPAKVKHPVVANSVEVVISKFTDAGVELLVKAKLRVEPSHPMVQSLLVDLSSKVRQLGALMVNV